MSSISPTVALPCSFSNWTVRFLPFPRLLFPCTSLLLPLFSSPKVEAKTISHHTSASQRSKLSPRPVGSDTAKAVVQIRIFPLCLDRLLPHGFYSCTNCRILTIIKPFENIMQLKHPYWGLLHWLSVYRGSTRVKFTLNLKVWTSCTSSRSVTYKAIRERSIVLARFKGQQPVLPSNPVFGTLLNVHSVVGRPR